MGSPTRTTALRALTCAVTFSMLTMGATVPALSPAAAQEALGREPLLTPEQLGAGAIDGLQYADPTEGLSLIDPPVPDTSGSAQLSYPLLVPPGRGVTPELTLTYDSAGDNGWVGLGWDLSVGEVAVDTTFGAPHFHPDLESESYLLDGDPLVPNALGESWEPRVAGDREDWTRQVETSYEQIIRHEVGDGGPSNYFWEVRDKKGNVRWYGGHPDNGGPDGQPLVSGGEQLTIDRDAIVTDRDGNAVRWLLSAQRDVGVNLVRYGYQTLRYQASGDGWERSPGCVDSPTVVCGEHTFLSTIAYTATAARTGEPEDPAYEVHLVLEDDLLPGSDGRLDPVVDGTGGYVDVLAERLARVEVLHGAPQGGSARDHDTVAVRYDLGYATDTPFAKSLLSTVTQSGGTEDTAIHEFAYFDEVRDGATYDGFAASEEWQTGSDLRTRSMLDDEVDPGALGASESHAAEGHAYVGFNPAIPQKVGSFGGSLQIGGGTTVGLAEWLDLDGDSLPDKVWKDGSQLKYRLNTSGPDGGTTFTGEDAPPVLPGISTLSSDSNIGLQGAVEAHLGVTASFGLGLDVSWGDTYFTDINADGLPDLVSGGQIYFNRLVDGAPSFQEGSGGTLVPLPEGGDPTIPESEVLVDLQADLAERSPLVDTVRRWVAPYAGSVTIDAPVTLAPAAPSKDGVRVAVQVGETEVASANLLDTGTSVFTDPLEDVEVDAGTPVYFRVGSVHDGRNDEVEWTPTITYTQIEGVDDVAALPTDVNGLSQTTFVLTEDFTLAGRPDSGVVMPYTGQVRFEATVTKTAVTTDDLTVVVQHNGVAVPGSDVRVPADFVGDLPVTLDLDVQQPTMPDPDHPDAPVPAPDTVEAHLAVDSPVDLAAISWDPVVYYLSAQDRDGNAMTVTRDGEPTILVQLIPDVDIYPRRTPAAVSLPWVSTTGDTVDAVVTLDLGTDHPGGEVMVSVKTRDGVVAQVPVVLAEDSDGGTVEEVVQLDADLEDGADYWVELTMTEPGVSARTTLSSLALRPTGPPTTPTTSPAWTWPSWPADSRESSPWATAGGASPATPPTARWRRR